jgi:ubiquinone/menaquinone biosynthesis C-methylase UbiE
MTDFGPAFAGKLHCAYSFNIEHQMNTEYKSAYIASQANRKSGASQAPSLVSQIHSIVQSLRESGPLPPQDYMQIIGSHDADHFTSNMSFLSHEILSRCKANPESSVLDIGCGCGRMALPMTRYLNHHGKFTGIDVWKEGIDWCTENISSVLDNCKFYTVPSKNNYYFSDVVSDEANSYRLDFLSDKSIDVAFAVSLFTHLRYRDALDYLKEIGRLLQPRGIAYVTCFIVDTYFFRFVKATGNHKAVTESASERGCFYAYSHQDFFAGFTMEVWNRMLKESGLWAICYETGTWADKPGGRMYQDTFVLGKLEDIQASA